MIELTVRVSEKARANLLWLKEKSGMDSYSKVFRLSLTFLKLTYEAMLEGATIMAIYPNGTQKELPLPQEESDTDDIIVH